MSVSVYRIGSVLLGAVLLLLTLQVLVAAPGIYDCVRTQYKNDFPVAWSGVVVCSPVAAEPPSPGAVQQMLDCLSGLGVEYDERALTGWRYYTVDDIITYPVPTGQIPVGFSNSLTRKIFVRRDLSGPVYDRVQLHETMHALRGGGHDPLYLICAGM